MKINYGRGHMSHCASSYKTVDNELCSVSNILNFYMSEACINEINGVEFDSSSIIVMTSTVLYLRVAVC